MSARNLLLLCATAFSAAAGSGVSAELVDPSDRSDVVRFYHEVYRSGEDYADHHGWTGSVSGCEPGTLSDEIQTDVITTVNYFRAMAGLPAEITLSPELNAKCQEAALMMARNNRLSHSPPSSWPCFTEDGAEAALHSNLSLGINDPHYGPDAVVGQIQDDGANNESVGHRRWILWTKAPDQMGHGSIPLTPIVGGSTNKNAAMALWVIGESTQVLPEDFEYVAWPPAGHVPFQLAFDRWSFGMPGANFDTASVTVSDSDGEIPTTIVHRTTGAGDPTIVFEPEGFPLETTPAADKTYTVTVSGISGAPLDSYTYEVTVIDPDTMPPVDLDGAESGYVGHASTFDFTPFTAAHCYELRVFETAAGDWKADAESAEKIINGTEADHALRTTSFAQSGSRAFHMTWDGESFEIDRDILPSASSELRFQQLFRWVGNTTSLIAEVSGSNGNWSEVWSRTGTLQGSASNSNWETAWTSVAVPLDAYEGQTIRLRFRYHREPGGFGWFPDYPGDQFHEFGAVLDNIEVTDSLEIASETLTSLPAGSQSAQFTPGSPGEFKVQIRAQIAGLWFGYSAPLDITANVGAPPVLKLLGTGIDPEGQFYIDAHTSGLTGLSVQTSTDGGLSWNTDDSFLIPSIPGPQIRLTSDSTVDGTRLFRLATP